MNWQYEYLDALNLAADAGDVESQITLMEYHGRKYSYGYITSGELKIIGVDHWDAEMKNLERAAKARHPEAQKRMGKYLFQGHPALRRDAIRGARLWLSGCIGARTYRSEALEKRLLKLANLSKFRMDMSKERRIKLQYQSFNPEENASCGVRFHYHDPASCHVVIEHLHATSKTAISLAIEGIATKILYALLLAGNDLEAEKIQWFEVYPAGYDEIARNGTLQKVIFEWNGSVYSKPKWDSVSSTIIPVDLTDIFISKDVH